MNRDLHDRAALVTGGTDGVGKEIARGLASLGVHLIVVGRDIEKGNRVARGLCEETGNSAVEFIPADLTLVSEATRLADEVIGRWGALNYLVHCAGVARGRHQLSAEGIESNFAVNYLSRFVLTGRLLPLLEAAGRPGAAARVLIIGGAAQNGRIHWEDVNLTTNFSTLRAVWQFCRANDLFTVELARRLALAVAPPRVTITSLKLGVVKTNIRRELPRWMRLLVTRLFDPLLGQTPQQAADSALRLLLAEGLEGVTGTRFMKIRRCKRIASETGVLETEAASRLWELSEALTGVRVTFKEQPKPADPQAQRQYLGPSPRSSEIANYTEQR